MESKLGLTTGRKRLLSGLKTVLAALPDKHAVRHIIVDGSFVQDEPNPQDVDLVVVVDSLADNTAGERILLWVDERALTLEIEFGCDAYVADQTMVDEYWSKQFGHTRNGREKGMLVLEAPK